MTETKKHPKGLRPWLVAWLGPTLLCAACARHPRIEYQVFVGVQLREDSVYRSEACQDTIEFLLSEVWESGFFQDDVQLLQEILNNNYGIFEYQDCPEQLTRIRAFYQQENEKERVMLNKSLFRHFDFSSWSEITLSDMDRGIKATLVHELLHDFWFKILNDAQKSRFTAEAEHFYGELSRVVRKQDKLDFLKRAGYRDPDPAEFEPFEEVMRLRNRYPDPNFFGTELFAVLGDRAFSGRILIPRRFHIYYMDILSEQVIGLTLF